MTAGRDRALLHCLLVLPALLMLTASPLSAAMPHLHLISMCTGHGPQLILAEGEDPRRPPRDDRSHAQMGCAHALCPRATLPERKGRGRC
jgi:hypothetical protein